MKTLYLKYINKIHFILIFYFAINSCHVCHFKTIEEKEIATFDLEAPTYFYDFILNEIYKEKKEILCQEEVNCLFASVVFTLEDSIITDVHTKLSRDEKNIIGIIDTTLLYKKVRFEFIENYNYSSYAFRLDISKLCN